MARHLIIAGHGELKSGNFDAGATGYITKGEHLYVEEDLFPAMRKYAENSKDTFIFHSAYKVLDRGNLAELVKQHKADTATEIHYDAFNESATGGHVIVHADFAPDELDLRLRDVIGEMVGLRFNHRGHAGISGRTNLGMVNTAKRNGLNFRLLELGFGTNKREADILVNQVDEYARRLVEAYDQSTHKATAVKPKPVAKKAYSKTIAQMADEVIANKHGNGHDNRRTSLGVSQSVYEQVRNEVNRRAGVTTRRETIKPKKSISVMASEVIEGQHGQGHSNRQKSLGISNAEYEKVRAEVNKRAGGKVPTGKSIDQMAKEVIDGHHGNGHSNRQSSLGVDNATYQKVREKVNQIL